MKLDRLISIIMILLDKKRIRAQELAEMFEVTSRTIYRDIDAINMAGIPIASTTGVGGGFEIMPNYKIDSNVFTNADLSAILMGLSNLAGMIHGDELFNAVIKVKSLIPVDRAKDIELKANQIYIDLTPWMGDRNMQPYLEIIKTALQENKLLSFNYADTHGNTTARIAEAYQLVLKSCHWYLQGYCLKRNDFRLFRLSRMSQLEITDKSFELRDYKKPQLDYEEAIANMQTKIKIRIHKSIVERVLDYCTFEDCVPDGEEHYIVDFPFIEKEYYYNILLGFGDKCECLEPRRIRDGLKCRIQNIVSMYDR